MEMSVLPPGFRFNPTDEELVMHYLKRKALGRKMEAEIIGDVDIYKFEPSDLPGLAILPSKDREWYFFNIQDKKNLHGSRLNRTTGSGYWKATGKDRKVNAGNCTMGMKKTLIYYHGRAPNGQRTDWIMHEYRLDEVFEKKIMGKTRYVLCRIRKKGGLGPRNGEQYGAPVLEVNEQDESDLINAEEVSDAKILNNINQSTVTLRQESPEANIPVDNTEELDSLFHILSGFGQPEPNDAFDIVSSSSDTDAIPDISRFPTSQSDNNENAMESLHDMLHPAEKEPEILEEMLREITTETEFGKGHQHSDDGGDLLIDFGITHDLDFGEFLELADLQSPNDPDLPPNLDGFGLRGDQDFGIELRRHHPWVTESMIDQGTATRRLLLQLEGPSLDVKHEEVRFEDRTHEVAADESHSPSGTKHFHIPINGHHDSSNLVTGPSSRKAMVEQSICKPNEFSEILIGKSEVQNSGLTGISEMHDSGLVSGAGVAQVTSSTWIHPLSPKSLFSRAVLGFLEDVPVLPASALELPLGNSQIEKPDSIVHVSDTKPLGALHQRVKSTTFESYQSTELVGKSQREFRKASGAGYSVFLFRMATSALILFCLIRGFCKLTRTALTVVL